MERIELTEAYFYGTSSSVVVLDENRTILDVNPSFTRIIGYEKGEAVGKRFEFLKSERHEDGFYESMWTQAEESGMWEGEVWNRRKDGKLYLAKRTLFTTGSKEDGTFRFIIVAREISGEPGAESGKFAYKDPVTELPNSYVFRELLASGIKEAKRKKRKIAVVMADVDSFHEINDSFGYAAGDRFLKEAAGLLADTIGRDTPLTRFGGDVFAFLIDDVANEREIAETLEKIGGAFEERLFHGRGGAFRLTMSLGVSMYPIDGKNEEELIRTADVARYRAKENGKGSSQFYKPELNVRVFERLMMETSLKNAIEKEELVLWYQPKIDMKTGKIDGMEALVRWKHPEMGLISPGKFIPLAEETGLIVPIGAWALKEACRQNMSWRKNGMEPLCVSVNVSSLQFRQAGLVESVREALESAGMEPESLELEITESMIIKDADEAVRVLKELKSLGVKVSIDDFGTGYSSLAYLAKLPVDALKIDRSFIQNVGSEEESAIASTIIAMAKKLRLEVVAEGAETEEHIRFLRQEKCDKFQGYYFSPPVEPDAFEDMVKKGGKIKRRR